MERIQELRGAWLLLFGRRHQHVQYQETVTGIGQERMPGAGGNHHALARIDFATPSVDLNLHRPGLGEDYLMKIVLVQLDLPGIRAQRQRERLGGSGAHP